MRRDPDSSNGDENPLDALMGELGDLDELEQRFALLDAHIDGQEGKADEDVDEDDPFSDIARALREHRANVDASRADPADDPLLDVDADEDSDLGVIDDEDVEDEDDPVAAEIEERCHDALDALEADDLSLAREIALGAVRLDDEHPFPMFVLGLVAEREGDLDMARDMAELSLRTAGTNADAIGLRAHIHVRQHELAEAEELLRYGIAHNPDDASLHEGLARIALARGRHDEALKAAGAALRLEPGNPGALAVRTAALEEGSDRGALLAALRQGVQLHPEDPYAMVELASVEMEHGNLDRARMLLVRAQRLAPRDKEIGDVRALVEHVYERPFLRPVPPLMRWIQDFPGGLPGFLVGFVIAALPLHALATIDTSYRIPAVMVIIGWGLVALYAWLAPAALTWRLDQRAAHAAAARLEDELEDPLSQPPSIERITEVLSMLGLARDRRRAARLSMLAAGHARSFAAASPSVTDGVVVNAETAPLLEAAAERLRSVRARMRSALGAIPVLPRLLVAAGTVCIFMAPALARSSGWSLLTWHVAAGTAFVLAWWLVRVQQRARRDLDESLAAIRLAAAQATPASDRQA